MLILASIFFSSSAYWLARAELAVHLLVSQFAAANGRGLLGMYLWGGLLGAPLGRCWTFSEGSP